MRLAGKQQGDSVAERESLTVERDRRPRGGKGPARCLRTSVSERTMSHVRGLS